MSNDTIREQAWQEIEHCCQTLCHREKVIDYITNLEEKVRELELKLESFRRSAIAESPRHR